MSRAAEQQEAGPFDHSPRNGAERVCLPPTEAEFRQLLSNLSDCLWSADFARDGHFEYRFYSPVIEKITGRPPEYFLPGPERWFGIIHPEDRPRLDRVFAGVRALEVRQVEEEYRVVLPDGGIRWVRDSVTSTDLGDRVRLNGVISDISERKRAEVEQASAKQELRQSEGVLRQLAENIHDVFYLLNLEPLQCEYCSPAYETVWGRPLSAVYQDPLDWMKAVLPEDLPRLRAGYEAGIRGEARLDEYRIRRPDGSIRWLRARCFPVLDTNGKMYRLAGVIEDITERRATELALQESEELNRLINETVPGGLMLFDRTGVIVRANQRAADLIGLRVDQLVGMCGADFEGKMVFEDGRPMTSAESPIGRCLETGQSQPPTILGGQTFDGGFVWLYGSVVPLKGSDGQLRLGAASFFDITPRIQAEAKLRASEESQRLIAELTHDYAYTCDVLSDYDIRMTSVTEGFTRFTGYTLEEILARGGWAALIHPDDLPGLGPATERLMSGQQGVNETRIVTKDGAVRWIRFSTRPIWDDKEQRVVRLLGAVQDITERKQAEEGLAESRRRLQALSHRLLEVQEQERRHLARELHDEIGQNLTGLQLILEMCRRTQGEAQQTRLLEAQRLVQELAGRVRDLSLDLRPSMLDDDLGLLPAVRFLCRRYSTQTGIKVNLAWHGSETRFPTEQETAVYRIVQEALTNAARHAGVQEVAVDITANPDWLEAVISDQGKGFVPDDVLVRGTTSGLSGMLERATLLGGSLHIDAAPGQGTRVAARLPLPEADGEP